MKLYWKAIYGEPEVIGDSTHRGHGYFSNEAWEKMLDDRFEAGKKAAQFEHERNGILILGAELRKKVEYWRKTYEQHEDVLPSAPLWDLDNLLETYNIPELKEDD